MRPDIPEARQLAEELKEFEVNITERGTFTAGAKSGSHDDLVISLSLALLLPRSAALTSLSMRQLIELVFDAPLRAHNPAVVGDTFYCES